MSLNEYISVPQRPRDGFRRYFTSGYFKLWVWYEEDRKTIQGFQLLYGGYRREKAITWKRTGTFQHQNVSDEGLDALKSAQVLEGNAGQVRPSTVYVFGKYAARIDRKLRDLVVAKITDNCGITQSMIARVDREYRRRKARGS